MMLQTKHQTYGGNLVMTLKEYMKDETYWRYKRYILITLLSILGICALYGVAFLLENNILN